MIFKSCGDGDLSKKSWLNGYFNLKKLVISKSCGDGDFMVLKNPPQPFQIPTWVYF